MSNNMNSIPQTNLEVNKNYNQEGPQLENLSGTCQRLYALLVDNRNYWRSKNLLQKDGSFFKSNKKLQEILGVKERTIRYTKKQLAAAGKIKFRTHRGWGKATYYWILDGTPGTQPDPAAASVSLQKLTPEKVKEYIRIHGKEKAIHFLEYEGYTRANVDTCLAP